ncbi:RPEL repeat protein [Talaromyces proteolyticus]|uniref:RPEL repeat protein n=1 Tax=Talaromyces proteolyticus TaxID=1131652 RepID=A0AAD4KFW4_9EURO|nr:RPEL repeat protein [Talaromyces proteolyticus]KAH8690096.1 RPEL repeat protein [Talaromyces proteolyticus]
MSSVIDESAISPTLNPTIVQHRRDSLEKHLQTRPELQDLKDRHILLDTNAAPSLQATQAELARRRASINLKKHLEKRPDRDDLVEKNILPTARTDIAPSLQANARDLERNMLADNLEHKIKDRPDPERLIAKGILDESEDPRSPTE